MPVPIGSVTEICFVTENIEAAVDRWAKTTGAGPFIVMAFEPSPGNRYRGEPAEDAFRAAIGFLGTTLIELLQPANAAPSIIREVLDVKGEGALHHIYPSIKPLDAAAYDAQCEAYRASGFVEALSLHLPGMGRNAFFDARDTIGCFLEVLEFDRIAYDAITERLHALHLNWNGEEPLRSIEALLAG
ncbi:VOC family protein [Sphingobium baderi]|uniref:VOC domain-containing protein n=1 Tax=Sphingobium baderi TaxID=1332080 RepID=A0A0S3EV90_9SPHN|nr:VOC family protein [Sphingobium baderi]ALR19340.1 hypothetical protein ATN00_02475 [Sphingobium baderi]